MADGGHLAPSKKFEGCLRDLNPLYTYIAASNPFSQVGVHEP